MEINALQILFQAVNFGVIFFILVKVLYQPIQKILKERADKINDGLRAAEKNLKAEAELEETKKKQLAKARRDGAKIIADAKKEAQVKANEIVKKAKADAKKEAQAIIETANSNAKAQQAEMAKELKELVIATTRKLLSETLSDKDIKAITAKMAKQLK